jgi:hypothetical protein
VKKERGSAEMRLERYMLDYPKVETYLDKQMGKEKKKLYPMKAYVLDSDLVWRVMLKRRIVVSGQMVGMIMGIPSVVRIPSGWGRVKKVLRRLW